MKQRVALTRIDTVEHAPDPGYVWDECLCDDIDPSDVPCIVCEARYSFVVVPRLGVAP